MLVYKFLYECYARQNLERKRLKISEYSDMNDPFELFGVNLPNKEIEDILIPHLTNNVGVLCFSKSFSNPLLWSHYADKHKGICLGFEIDTSKVEIKYPSYVTGIQYINNFQAALLKHSEGNPKEAEENMEKILLTKFIDWKYEDEVRVLLKKDNKDGEHYFFMFDEIIRLTQVITGVRYKDNPEYPLCNILNAFPYKLEITKTTLSKTSFEVITA
jgi:hypothetical protein